MSLSKNKKGLIITFSGLDGAGKSTQMERVRACLEIQGRRTVRFWSRGGYTPGMEALKRWLRRSAPDRVPPPGQSLQRNRMFARRWVRRGWLALAILDLLFLYAVRMRCLRRLGCVVLCDRYLWDTAIDFELNFPQEKTANWRLWRWLARLSPRPDQAFLFLLSLDEADKRLKAKQEPFPQDKATLRRRHDLYTQLAREQHSFQVIQTDLHLDRVTEKILERLPALN